MLHCVVCEEFISFDVCSSSPCVKSLMPACGSLPCLLSPAYGSGFYLSCAWACLMSFSLCVMSCASFQVKTSPFIIAIHLLFSVHWQQSLLNHSEWHVFHSRWFHLQSCFECMDSYLNAYIHAFNSLQSSFYLIWLCLICEHSCLSLYHHAWTHRASCLIAHDCAWAIWMLARLYMIVLEQYAC